MFFARGSFFLCPYSSHVTFTPDQEKSCESLPDILRSTHTSHAQHSLQLLPPKTYIRCPIRSFHSRLYVLFFFPLLSYFCHFLLFTLFYIFLFLTVLTNVCNSFFRSKIPEASPINRFRVPLEKCRDT